MAKLNYVELPVQDVASTKAFFATAFGWDFTDYGPTYAATGNGTTDVGLQGDPGDALSAPLPVIRTDDLESAFDAVSRSGGVMPVSCSNAADSAAVRYCVFGPFAEAAG